MKKQFLLIVHLAGLFKIVNMKKMGVFISIASVLSLFPNCANAKNDTISVQENRESVVIENELVNVSFNLDSGIYTAVDKRDNSICIEDAFFSINKYESTGNLIFE